MSETTLKNIQVIDPEILNQSETDTDFTLDQHHSERIAHHMKMLRYYLNEEKKHGTKST